MNFVETYIRKLGSQQISHHSFKYDVLSYKLSFDTPYIWTLTFEYFAI